MEHLVVGYHLLECPCARAEHNKNLLQKDVEVNSRTKTAFLRLVSTDTTQLDLKIARLQTHIATLRLQKSKLYCFLTEAFILRHCNTYHDQSP